MTLDQFFSAYNGRKVDVDGGFPANNPYQCWDLAAAYARDFVGVPVPYLPTVGGGVYSSYTQFPGILPEYFFKVENHLDDPNWLPLRGDVVIFNSSWGAGYGHVGIVQSATKDNFVLLEQNNPLGSGSHFVTHPAAHYQSVAGWLRPKKLVQPSPATTTQVGANKDMTPQFINNAYLLAYGRTASPDEVSFHMAKSTPQTFTDGLVSDKNRPNAQVLTAQLKDVQAALDDAKKKLSQVQGQPANTTSPEDEQLLKSLATTLSKILEKK